MSADFKPPWPYVLDAQSPQAKGLVSWWAGDPSGGGQLFDLSGFSKNGSLVNAPKWVPGKGGGNALLYNGSTQRVNLPNDFAATAVTMSAWIKSSSTTQYQYVYSGLPNTGGMTINPAGQSNVGYFDNNNGTWVFGGPVVNNGIWHHIAATKVGLIVAFYVDGRYYPPNDNQNGSLTAYTGTRALGARADGAFFFGGVMDDFRLYNRALSPAEIWAIVDPATSWSLRYQPGKTLYFLGSGAVGSMFLTF